MPRALHILFHSAAALSAALLLALLVLWPVSYIKHISIRHKVAGRYVAVASIAAHIAWEDIDAQPSDDSGLFIYPRDFHKTWNLWSYFDTTPEPFADYRPFKFLGLYYDSGSPRYASFSYHCLLIPHSYFVLIFSILPAGWLFRFVRRRRQSGPGFPPDLAQPPLKLQSS